MFEEMDILYLLSRLEKSRFIRPADCRRIVREQSPKAELMNGKGFWHANLDKVVTHTGNHLILVHIQANIVVK